MLPKALLRLALILSLVLLSDTSGQTEPARTAPPSRPVQAFVTGSPAPAPASAGTRRPARASAEPADQPAPSVQPAGAEVRAARTANSVTYRNTDGSFTSVIDAAPMHYPDALGDLHPVDPTFDELTDYYVAQRNILRSRADRRSARLAVGLDSAALNWQARELGMVDADGAFHALARVLAGEMAVAELDDAGRRLRYTGGWTTAGIAEELVSTPGSIEHLTVLAQRPGLPASTAPPQYLELRAMLKLNDSSVLWADGRAQHDTFSTTGALEVRGATEHDIIQLAPVRAYELGASGNLVPGFYVVHLGAAPGEWVVGLRTPWSWWADPARRYPAVIDPEMRVLRSAGYGAGMAWVANGSPALVAPDAQSQAMQFGELVLGSFYMTTAYRGYVQFNHLPYLLSNAPISIATAYLDVTPAGRLRPGYDDSSIDWKKQDMQWPAKLYALGQCPAACNGFSLVGGAPSFTWADSPNPANSTLSEVEPGAKKALAVKGPDAKDAGAGQTTTWDVTNELRTWYQHSPRPADGPLFMLTMNTNCTVNAGYPDDNRMDIRLPAHYAGDVSLLNPDYIFNVLNTQFLYLHLGVGQCTRARIAPGGVRLRIQYSAPTLSVGKNWLNMPGIPSYDAAFDNATTYHEYNLGGSAFQSWQGIAARSNHTITLGLPARLTLELYGSGNQPLATNGGTGKDQTLFALIDTHNGAAFNASWRARVQPSAENDLLSDGQRNYRLHYEQAGVISTTYGIVLNSQLVMPSTDLLLLKELPLAKGDNTQIVVQVPAPFTQSVSVALARPTSGGVSQAVRSPNNNADGLLMNPNETISGSAKISSLTFAASTGGNWALALINQGRPLGPVDLRGEGRRITVTLSILRCPEGSIPTRKWGCQPVTLPRIVVYPPYTTTTVSQSGLSLTVYSEGGFGVTSPTQWCTRNEGQGTPIIGPSAGGRWVAVGQGSVCRNGDTITTTADSGLFLTIQTGAPVTDVKGQFMPGFIYGDTALSPVPPGAPTGIVTRSTFLSNVTLAPGDDTRRTLQPFAQWKSAHASPLDLIDVTGMTAAGLSEVSVAAVADTSAAAPTVTWTVAWLLYPAPLAAPDLPYAVVGATTQAPTFTLPITISTLLVRILGATPGTADQVDFWKKETGPDVEFFHAPAAKVTLDDTLGGASKNAQVVVLPPGKARRLDQSNQGCGETRSCLDLRRDDYAWQGGQGENSLQMWELPDAHITGQAGAVIFNRAGQLNVFSQNQPGGQRTANSLSVPFSFDTWEATVTARQGVCDGAQTTIIEGAGKIALPMLGDDGGSVNKPIDVQFTLCKTALRAALLAFDASAANLPGIPIGSTGLEVVLVSGQVQVIDQADTEITLKVGFRSAGGGYPLNKGAGSITINTGGFFEIDGSAEVVSYFDADFKLAVAWNPLDVLLAGSIGCCDDLIEGGIKLHTWVGQGWQHKYPWLPDDSAQHFTGSIGAQLRIPTGYVVDDWPFVLPPFKVGAGVEIAFGELCTSGSCSQYAWGMSSAVSVFGYDVGVYVDSSGPSLILGSNDHQLIDEAAGAQAQAQTTAHSPSRAPAKPDLVITGNWWKFLVLPWRSPASTWQHASPQSAGCQISGTTHTCPFTVTAGAGRALFSATWHNGWLDVALIKPDGSVITPGNAGANGVTVTQIYSPSLSQVTYAARAPAGSALATGVWRLRLGNVGGPGPVWSQVKNNYGLLFASDPAAPTITWQSPLSDVAPDGNGIVTLEWQALRPAKPLTSSTKIELFYAPWDQRPLTPTAFAGLMLADRYTATLGAFAWDTRGLASGRYAVGARIDDHLNGNGHVVAWAPGSVTVSDTTPPPAPTVLITSFVAVKDALLVGWVADLNTPDLAGYLISYTIPSWDVEAGGPPLTRARRLTPSSPERLLKLPFMPLLERARLGGLLNGAGTTLCVRAFDASGNLSDCTPIYHRLPPDGNGRIGPVEELAASMVGVRTGALLRLTWRPPLQGTPAGYLVDFAPTACKRPGATAIAVQGTPAQFVGDTTVYTLTGLTPAQMYRFDVRAVTAEGYAGPVTTTQAMFFDDLTDSDGDGIPNQWADTFGLNGADADRLADPDADGLNNAGEQALGAFPNRWDSNADGFSDGEAAEAGLDPCGLQSPPYHQGPKPVLAATSNFAFASFVNLPKVAQQLLTIADFGNGPLDWTIDQSAPWITLSATRGNGPAGVQVGADPTGLPVGRYTGVVTITLMGEATSAAGRLAADANQATIIVTLDVWPAHGLVTYLPVVRATSR